MERPTSEIAWAGSRGPGGAARTELGASSAMERGMTMRRDTMMEQISQLNPCSQLHPLNGRLQPLCDYDIAPMNGQLKHLLDFSCTDDRLPWALDGHY